jgi:processive 1,2-diacylglycerol beta-glucosyltransferase
MPGEVYFARWKYPLNSGPNRRGGSPNELKKILILTAGFGEGHNAAARGIHEGLQHVALGEADVEMHDLFAETYGAFNEFVRKSYLGVINRAPRSWAAFYKWLDRKKNFDGDFKILFALRRKLARLIEQTKPGVIVSVYPAYAHLLKEIMGDDGGDSCKRLVVVTDSITINGIWYRCPADYFLVPNDPTARVMREVGVDDEKIKALGFPVSPKFAALNCIPKPEPGSRMRVLYMINAGKRVAPEIVRRLTALPDVELTVTVGRDEKLRGILERLRSATARSFDIVGWTNDMPRLMQSNHLLIGKAGGATVQETIAASLPMIINQVVPGQEEGNARLIMETHCGAIAATPETVIAEVQRAFADDQKLWREWFANIRQLGRPSASLDIARFILSL